jgi:hypothetical protein
VLVETGEQIFNGTHLHEMFPKQPDRLGVRHVIAQPQAEEAHEGKPILDLEPCLVV